MGKTYRDRPAKQRDIAIKKMERGNHRKMNPYRRTEGKRSGWESQEF